jgi:hypothetical protein
MMSELQLMPTPDPQAPFPLAYKVIAEENRIDLDVLQISMNGIINMIAKERRTDKVEKLNQILSDMKAIYSRYTAIPVRVMYK